jgi:DNA-binding MarR family transcriptional regulator
VERKAVPETPCSCAMLRRTARCVTRRYDRALRPVGLRLTQYSILANLDSAGAMSITALAERLGMDRSTLSRNLRPLERAGLVRFQDGSDRRAREAAITAAGHDRLTLARPYWQEAEGSFRRALGPTDSEALRRLLARASSI